MASNPFQLDPAFTQQITQPAPQPQKSGGMFGGDWKTLLAAGLAGFTARSNPGLQQALFAAMAQKQRQAEEASQYQRERADKQTDWQAQYDYKRANPEQGDDEYTRALVASGVQPGSPEWARHMANRAGILENPPRYVMVNGALVQVGGPQSSAPAPTAPVGKLTPLGAGGPAPGPGGFHY